MDVFIGNLNRSLDEKAIKKLFEAIGKVNNVRLVRHKKTGESKGFGFVEMENAEDATLAVKELHGKEIGGLPITVQISTWNNGEKKEKAEVMEKKTQPKKKRARKSTNQKTEKVFSSTAVKRQEKSTEPAKKEESYKVNEVEGGYVKIKFD